MARRKAPPRRELADGIPAEVAERLHPIWRDADALAAHPVLGRYVDPAAAARAEMGGRMYHHVVRRWACDNGYAHPTYPVCVDWTRLRADLEPA